MNFLKTIISTSYDISAAKPDRTPVFVYCKLVEECTELSDVYHGIAASEPLNGEIADVIISAIDLLYIRDFHDAQLDGCMNKEEMIDAVINCLTEQEFIHQGTLEEYWFQSADLKPQSHLNVIFHCLGRITRLLNQPDRSDDKLITLLVRLIKMTGAMACAVGLMNGTCVGGTRMLVESTVETKVEKWRGKFGL